MNSLGKRRVAPAEKSGNTRPRSEASEDKGSTGGRPVGGPSAKTVNKKGQQPLNIPQPEEDDEDHGEEATKKPAVNIGAHTHTLRAILPQIINEQNRKTFGTWQRQFDFARTIIGYLLGIHNFFRFPYLCYKFGGVFFFPYVIMMLIVGIPMVFMEFTIGQYYGVGSYVAFTHMSPILSGVSKLLTWSCVVNCWMYTVILAWLRIYSNDATSCLKGWEICHDNHYYNTPHCFTGTLDDECNDLTNVKSLGLNVKDVMENDMIYFNYRCQPVKEYCIAHGWTLKPEARACLDSNGNRRSIYERRYHATEEFFYGAVLGLQRKSEVIRDEVLVKVALTIGKVANVKELVPEIYYNILPKKNPPEPVPQKRIDKEQKWAVGNPISTVRRYLTALKESKHKPHNALYRAIKDEHAKKMYQDLYWEEKAQRLTEDKASSSFKELQQLSLTTWIMIAVFLFEDLLKVSFLSYILNAVPFLILIYVTTIAVSFKYSGYGIEHIFSTRDGFFQDLANFEIWCEAVIQVIYTTGVGNGVLISLATYNNINHNYTVDLYATLTLAIITSCCGVLITFCSLGQYLKMHQIDVPFREYIRAQSSSSVEFCLVVYSIFLTLISDQNVTIILFFFMLTSFATDTAIRLVQSVLDTVMDISSRFKHHSAMVLVAVCSMGYLMLVPIMKNGSFVLFVDFEYFTLNFMMPTIVLIEIGSCVFVYKSRRIIDHSEQMGVFTSYSFRLYMLICSYLACVAILATVILNVTDHDSVRFNGVRAESVAETFGWVFFLSPLIMVTLSVVKQLIVVPPSRWGWLLMPLKGKHRKVLRRIQRGDGPRRDIGNTTDQEDIREAALKWRKMESNLLLAMMAKRRSEKEKEEGEEKKKQTPLFISLVKLAAAAKKEDDELFGGNLGKHDDDVEGGNGGNVNLEDIDNEDDVYQAEPPSHLEPEALVGRRSRRMAFIHVKKVTFFARMAAAFMGKAVTTGKTHRPKRHAGGGAKSRIVTRHSVDGSKTVNLEEDEENQSEESLSNDDEDGDEKLREQYLDAMDYVERWPGRLDESEIESEGSSIDESGEEVDDVF